MQKTQWEIIEMGQFYSMNLLNDFDVCASFLFIFLNDLTIYFCFAYNSRRPTNLSIVWTRRSRRVASTPLAWEPDMVNPLVGHISWAVPDNHTISVTLFKDSRTHELEDKDWTFVIEDVSVLPFCKHLCVSTDSDIGNYLVQNSIHVG